MAPLGILPTELWLLVALHIDDQADWSRLSQISRANYEQWTPYLYRNINIFTMKSLLSLAAFAKMHRSLDRWRRLRLHSLLFRHKRPSPFRSVQNLRVLISREATMTRQFRVNLRDAVKTLLLTWLVNFGLDVSLSRSGILHLLPPTCRLVYEQFHYPSWTLPRRLRATHLSLSCKPTRDSNITRLPAAPRRSYRQGLRILWWAAPLIGSPSTTTSKSTSSFYFNYPSYSALFDPTGFSLRQQRR
ncbi:hypothetical protein BKA62DRAFT_364377 [Auriculariales sp. MPI-PUGE-AT-0066]|nr:hypothetical protein BKA62DRAFT_364377 [Auriculariales sp. MPI-PUGE-AT-0066]